MVVFDLCPVRLVLVIPHDPQAGVRPILKLLVFFCG
jgi:hypothetical protein